MGRMDFIAQFFTRFSFHPPWVRFENKLKKEMGFSKMDSYKLPPFFHIRLDAISNQNQYEGITISISI